MKMNPAYLQRNLQENLLLMDQDRYTKPAAQVKDRADLFGSNPVKVDISQEGMAQYRKTIQQNTPKAEEAPMLSYDLERLTNHSIELSARVNEINAGRKDLTVKEYANSLFQAYASLYAEISDGYDKGTRSVYSWGVDGPLSKEEDLAKLDEAFKSHAQFFETIYQNHQEEDQKRFDQSLQEAALGKLSSGTLKYLQDLAQKRENQEYVPSNIAERILNAGESFVSKLSAHKDFTHNAIMNYISSISVW